VVVLGGFRAAIRTSAGDSAEWIFAVTETGHLRDFQNGIRIGAIATVVAIVALLVPRYAGAWGTATAVLHAVNGAALGWLLVEVVLADVDRPLISTMPSSDGLNTEGVVFMGLLVVAVVILARIERATMLSLARSVLFAPVVSLAAVWMCRANRSA
jgi:hypothetical protein